MTPKYGDVLAFMPDDLKHPLLVMYVGSARDDLGNEWWSAMVLTTVSGSMTPAGKMADYRTDEMDRWRLIEFRR